MQEQQIKAEFEKSSKIKVSDFGTQHQPIVKEFKFHDIREKTSNDYPTIKAKFGPLAATDLERRSKEQRDRRFTLNPLLREPLSVEGEERRAIEERVQTRIQALAEVSKADAAAIGYKEGWKKGYEDAFKEFEVDGSVSLKNLDHLLVELNECKFDIFKANERFLMEIIFRISKSVILREINLDSEYLLRLSRELITKIGPKENITLRISSEEAQTIEVLRQGILKYFGQMNSINIETSNKIARGACQVETEWTSIDASIDQQLEGIHQALVGLRKDRNSV